MPGNNGHKNLKKHVTKDDLAETRSKILKAADELDQRIDEHLEWAKNWQTTARHYPIEMATGLFAVGFILGSGILEETLGAIFSPKTIGKRKDKRRRSKKTLILSQARRISTLIITMFVLDRIKKQTI